MLVLFYVKLCRLITMNPMEDIWTCQEKIKIKS